MWVVINWLANVEEPTGWPSSRMPLCCSACGVNLINRASKCVWSVGVRGGASSVSEVRSCVLAKFRRIPNGLPRDWNLWRNQSISGYGRIALVSSW
jgi:hypothetical protein